MSLDAQVCYRALASRDARFDGKFFTGVLTTGIYCRPVCPARTPKAANVEFFACAASAEAAGFRPCLRCRPEASPGTPAWVGTGATVSRALRLINEGALDSGGSDGGVVEGCGVEDLADRLGVGGRHLRRLFVEHLGTTPMAVAQTRRVQFAKRLIDETELPIAQIAFTAGFGSIRRFNAVFSKTYHRAPGALRHSNGARGKKVLRHAGKSRRGSKPACAGSTDAGIVLRLAYRPPLDWEALLGFLAARAIPGVEEVRDGRYRRAVIYPGGASGMIEVRMPTNRKPPGRKSAGQTVRSAGAVRSAGSYLEIEVSSSLAPHLQDIATRTRRLFDLRADPAEIDSQLARSPALRRMVKRRPGVRVPGAWDPFEIAVRAVLGQQISVRGATTLARRLAERHGKQFANSGTGDVDGGGLHIGFPTRTFPDAATLARADLDGLGILPRRARVIRALAAAVAGGELVLDGAQDLETLVGQLKEFGGIGEWTAQYIAMRASSEPDAFPSGDLGVIRSLAAAGLAMKPAELLGLAEAWRPWRAYAVMHLWLAEGSLQTVSRAKNSKTKRPRPRRKTETRRTK